MADRGRWSIVSTGDLVAYHLARCDVYRALFALLQSPLTPSNLETAKERMQHARVRVHRFQQLEALHDALADTPADAIAAAHSRAIRLLASSHTLTCEDPRAPGRHGLLAFAGLGRTAARLHEVEALARLAERTAGTLSEGDVAQAAALADAQSRFLRHHGLECLTALATCLRGANGLYAHVGAALEWLVKDDSESLGPQQGSPPPSPDNVTKR